MARPCPFRVPCRRPPFGMSGDSIADPTRGHFWRAEGGHFSVALKAKYLVSCEGAHSTVRKQAGIAFTGKTYPLDFAMADVHLDWHNSHDRGHVWFHRDGMFAAMAMPGEGRWRLFVDITGVAREDTEVDLALVQRIMVERTGETEPRASRPTWLTRFKIKRSDRQNPQSFRHVGGGSSSRSAPVPYL